MSAPPIQKILVCGHGIAFEMMVAALAQCLAETIEIIALKIDNLQNYDAFYGSITAPTAHRIHLSLGLDEAKILSGTDTTFAYGTEYENWAGGLNWVQSYHLPFPVWDNIPFHQYLIRSQQALEPYLVSAVAGKKGVFAHPPQDPQIPLSRAEYGYQIRPSSIAKLLFSQPISRQVTRKNGVVSTVEVKNGKLAAVHLNDGQTISADLFIDASGPAGLLMSAIDNPFVGERRLGFAESVLERHMAGTALRQVAGHDFGWQSRTTLRDKQSILTVFSPDMEKEALAAHPDSAKTISQQIELGRRATGWAGNCIAVGHTGYITEPTTPAPLMLLHKDIERVASLIPVSLDMTVEMREFNRLRENDLDHCELFQRALLETADLPGTSYWQDASASPISAKLARKITQFESRGFLTGFDLEPFNEQDWAILHFGMGRRPRRYDVFLDSIPKEAAASRLDQLRQSIEMITGKMPPHDRYLAKFLSYLERKNAGQS